MSKTSPKSGAGSGESASSSEMDKPKKIYRVHENREVAKSEKQVLDELKELSFAEEIERDVERTAVMLSRPDTARHSGASKESVAHEEAAASVYKRAMMMIGSSGATVTADDGSTEREISRNGLPISSYLNHGSRTMIEIPAGSGHELFNWLTSGDKNKSAAVPVKSQKEALQKNGIVYNRRAATHSIEIENGRAVEKKGFMIGFKSFVKSFFSKNPTKHWGVDLAANAEYGGKDSTGHKVTFPDGDHGHLYIYYKPATATEPGGLLIGNEGGSPTSHKHSKVGNSDPLSPMDASKFRDLKDKHDIAAEKAYRDTVIPRKYNGIRARPSADVINAITNMDDRNFGADVAAYMPADNPAGFSKGTKFHPPKHVASKPPGAEPRSPSMSFFKKIVTKIPLLNKISAIKSYKKELQEYSEKKKAFKAQNIVRGHDSIRIKHEDRRLGSLHADLTHSGNSKAAKKSVEHFREGDHDHHAAEGAHKEGRKVKKTER